MSAITWGVGGDNLATVFCIHCGAVFVENIQSYEASARKAEIEPIHHCTPSKPWRPGSAENKQSW